MTEGGASAFKVVEVAPVGEETLERALNEQAQQGWAFQSIHFVTREGSHRPALAFLFFAKTGTGVAGVGGLAPGPARVD